jgi:homoserine kinase
MLTNGVGSSAAAAADVAAAVAFAEECLKKVEMRVGMGTR